MPRWPPIFSVQPANFEWLKKQFLLTLHGKKWAALPNKVQTLLLSKNPTYEKFLSVALYGMFLLGINKYSAPIDYSFLFLASVLGLIRILDWEMCASGFIKLLSVKYRQCEYLHQSFTCSCLKDKQRS